MYGSKLFLLPSIVVMVVILLRLCLNGGILHNESKFKMTQILEHLFSKLTSRSFKPVSSQSKSF